MSPAPFKTQFPGTVHCKWILESRGLPSSRKQVRVRPSLTLQGLGPGWLEVWERDSAGVVPVLAGDRDDVR